MENSQLFSTLNIGNFQLKNRIVMAPLTRCRADAQHVPTPMMATYYAQRATAGLVIAEATMAIEGHSAFWREPGIYSKAHVDGWRRVTDAVHKAGGIMALQIWHGGRACHPLLNNGTTPVAPSALRIENDEVHTPEGKKAYVTPRALEISEIAEIVAGFKEAATYAKDAGFDMVEVHAANGYLIDEFLRDGSNKREDKYGGSLENRSRLLLEVVDAVSSVYASQSVGVRISPLNSYNDMRDSNPIELTAHVAAQLDAKGLGYLHVMRGDFMGIQKGDVLTPARKNFKSIIIANGGYTPAEADDAITSGLIDAVAFGHHYVSNPDLVERVKRGHELVEPNPRTFYTQGEEGYTDYQFIS